jgi:DNA-directed RNA polymerase sigma subunit (sigma70/sigma32)
METRSKKALARAVTALESVTNPRERAEIATTMTDEAKRIRREAFAELKKTHTFAQIGAMFGITGSRVDQIMREGQARQNPDA